MWRVLERLQEIPVIQEAELFSEFLGEKKLPILRVQKTHMKHF